MKGISIYFTCSLREHLKINETNGIWYTLLLLYDYHLELNDNNVVPCIDVAARCLEQFNILVPIWMS